MAIVLNIVIPILAGVAILVALYFILRALGLRSQQSRQPYDVGRQELRRSMHIDFIRAIVAAVVGLVLLGLFGLDLSSLAETAPAPTATRPATETVSPPTATAPARPSATATTNVTSPTPLPPSPTPTMVPATDTPTPEPTPSTATVQSGVGVWLRAAPSAEAEQIEWVLDGTLLTLLPGREQGAEFAWQQVRTPEGNEGWVAVDFIDYSE